MLDINLIGLALARAFRPLNQDLVSPASHFQVQTISLTTEVRMFRCSDILAVITRYSHVYVRVHLCARDSWVHNFRGALYVQQILQKSSILKYSCCPPLIPHFSYIRTWQCQLTLRASSFYMHPFCCQLTQSGDSDICLLPAYQPSEIWRYACI